MTNCRKGTFTYFTDGRKDFRQLLHVAQNKEPNMRFGAFSRFSLMFTCKEIFPIFLRYLLLLFCREKSTKLVGWSKVLPPPKKVKLFSDVSCKKKFFHKNMISYHKINLCKPTTKLKLNQKYGQIL